MAFNLGTAETLGVPLDDSKPKPGVRSWQDSGLHATYTCFLELSWKSLSRDGSPAATC